MAYIVKIKQVGNNVVLVYKKIQERYVLDWMLELKQDDEPIEMSEIVNDMLIISNWEAWIRIFSISKKKLIFEKKYDSDIVAKALISMDKTKLYVAANPKSQPYPILEIISLNDFSISKSIPLPQQIRTNFFNLDKRNPLFYYCNIDITGSAEHGYYRLHLESNNLKRFSLPYPQWQEFDMVPPYISSERDIGAMPLWDTVEIVGEGDRIRFCLKIMIFDLSTFEILNILTIREFSTKELAYSNSNAEDMAEIFQEGSLENEDYREAVSDFITENIYSIYFAKDQKIWVSFRGGIVRCISENFQLSPLFVTSRMPNSSGKGAFNFPVFHSYIDRVEKDRIILKEHGTYYEMEYTASEVDSCDEIVPKSIGIHSMLDDIQDAEIDNKLEEFGKILIKVKDLSQDSSFLQALDQMILLTNDIDTVRKGHLLRFSVADEDLELDENEFFQKSVKIKGGVAKIVHLITNFVNYKKAYTLYYDDETTALAYAVYHLAEHDEKYIDVAVKYLSIIDYEHDVFNREKLLAMFFKKYGITKKAQKRLIDKIRKVGEEWLEGYIED